MKPIALIATTLTLLLAPTSTTEADAFSDYWHQGQAELTSYALEQARYGEVHPGEAVLIFVTEPFSRQKQVKLDGDGAPGDAVPVLKLNFTKTFNTGIYPYSMMTSAFTPVGQGQADAATLKVTTSSQEWCGHSFTQLNRIEDGYRLTEMSYFESEGDRQLELEDALPEDGVWNLIRLDPAALPTGRVRMIPGVMFQRLSHQAWQPAWARATLEADPEDPTHSRYTLAYPDRDRTLSIRFATAFPHEIASWEERYTSGNGPSTTQLVTRGTLKKRIMLDYWRRNSVADAPLRETLDLD